MMEALQQSSPSGLTNLVLVIVVLWLIWPVACGLIAYNRGQTLQGVVHGLLWGPIGVIIVLLSSRRYVCPTCGQKTLRAPLAAQHSPPAVPPGPTPSLARKVTWPVPPLKRQDTSFAHGPAARPAPSRESATTPPPGSSTALSPGLIKQENSNPPNATVSTVAAAGCGEEEAERLRAWVNAD